MIEIYFDDLTPEKQQEIIEAFGGKNNYDVFPIAIIATGTMETRGITQVRLYVLCMNHTADCAESNRIVAVSDDYYKLVDYYNSQYTGVMIKNEYGHHVFFREDSPLRFYNKLQTLNLNELDMFGHGIKDEWVDLSELDSIKTRFDWI